VRRAARARTLRRAGRGLAEGRRFSEAACRRHADADFRGVLETDDGATILFASQGYGRTAADGVRQLVGAMTHLSDAERYRWLDDVICTVAGVVEPRADGHGLDVVLDISELVWEAAGA
jgi:hypothetical protein